MSVSHFSSDYYSVSLSFSEQETRIILKLNIYQVTTRSFPQTYLILKKLLPAIFAHRCFNGKKLPFSEEVKKTELGHLFEHVLLEYLSKLKTQNGVYFEKINGVTNWNWLKNPRGVFDISISSGVENSELIIQALSKTYTLMDVILNPVLLTLQPLSLFEPKIDNNN